MNECRCIPDYIESLSCPIHGKKPEPYPLYDAEMANALLDKERTLTVRQKATIGQLCVALEMASKFCHLRRSGFCYSNCRANILCDAKNLTILPYQELPESLKELVYG